MPSCVEPIRGRTRARRQSELPPGVASGEAILGNIGSEFRLLEILADAVVASDAEDRVLYLNAAAERLLGWSREELLGQPLTVLMPPRMRPIHEEGFHRYFRTGVPHLIGKPIRVPALSRDGSELDVELILAATRVDGREVVIATMRDLRARVELERELRTRSQVAAQHEVMTVLASTRTPAEAWPRVLDATGRTLGYEMGVLWTEVAGRLQAVGSWEARPGSVEAFLEACRTSPLSFSKGLVGKAWREQAPVIVGDLERDSTYRRRQIALESGMRSALVFPVVGRERTLGVVEFLSAEIVEADEELSRTLQTLGLQLGQFLERLNAEAQLHENLEWFATTLRSVGDAVIATRPDGTVRFLNAAAERLTGYSEQEAVGRPLEEIFSVLNAETGAAIETPTAGGRRDPPRTEQAPTVLRDRQGRLIPIEEAGSPIRLGGGEIGVVLVFRDASARRQLEVERLRRMQEAVRARMDAEQRARRATLLARAGAVLNASLHPEETLQNLARLIVPDHADWCVVELLMGEAQIPRQVAVAHVDPKKVRLAEELGRFPARPRAAQGPEAVMRTGRAELHRDIPEALLVQVARSEEHLALMRAVKPRSAMVVPLTARGRTFGALTLISAESGRRFTEDDLQFAEQLADRAALSVDNARLYQEAQAAVRLRDDFLSVASHELRTPLTPLQLQLAALRREGQRLLRSPDASGALEKRLVLLQRQSERLARLVNELLDISRLSAGRLRLELEPTDLGETVREVVAHFNELGELERFGSRVELEETPGVVGRWDPARLEQIISNLLTNALKYGEQRPIRMVVRREEGHAILQVEDHGIGISSEDQERIFGRFERAVSGRHIGGLGLGLFIVRQVAEALGGGIDVKSTPGVGSTFTLRLPLAGPAEELAAAGLH